MCSATRPLFLIDQVAILTGVDGKVPSGKGFRIGADGSGFRAFVDTSEGVIAIAIALDII